MESEDNARHASIASWIEFRSIDLCSNDLISAMTAPAPRRSPPSTSCIDLFRAFSPVKGRSPSEAARFPRALTGLGKQSSAKEAEGLRLTTSMKLSP